LREEPTGADFAPVKSPLFSIKPKVGSGTKNARNVRLSKRNKAILLCVGLVCLALISFALGAFWQVMTQNEIISRTIPLVFMGPRKIQTLESPNRKDSATLYKINGLGDINFIVKVNGVQVYRTGDLETLPDHLYRETLLWDKKGEVLVLELMGKKVFAYNTAINKALYKGELRDYSLSPLPTDDRFSTPLEDIDK
jgi:hypothetical protein